MKKNSAKIRKIFSAKEQRRRDLAKLPIEEKVKILVQLQKMAIPILSARDIKHKAWPI